jgi:hypothetical protein
MDSNFFYYGGYKLYGISVEIMPCRVFYNADKTKMMCWLLYKKTDDTGCRRKKISYNVTPLIGYRASVDTVWKLYPFANRSTSCFDSLSEAIAPLEKYYFEQMKHHQMVRVIQSGPAKGYLDSKEYGYNLQEPDFWEKSWLWEKDTVASNGLYPFEIKRFGTNVDTCIKCAIPYDPPMVKLPDSILKMYMKK